MIKEASIVAPALLSQLVNLHGAQWVHAQNLSQWRQAGGHQVLLFAGDPVRFPESMDVAVVLPELQKACAAKGLAFDVGVAVPEQAQALALSFGSQHWPTLMFFQDGKYQTTVAGMHDWTDFVALVERALQASPARPPTVGIPVVSSSPSSSCH